VLGAALLLLIITHGVQAGASITNGVVQIGVDDEGQLNEGTMTMSPPGTCNPAGASAVGLRFVATGCESTSDGCLCEGWGASYDIFVPSGVPPPPGSICTTAPVCSASGAANNAYCNTVTPVSFASTATTAVSTVTIGQLQVIQDYHPSLSPNLFEDHVTLTNTNPLLSMNNVRYERAMDWDIEPTPFSEYSTIYHGTSGITALEWSSDNGFVCGNPTEPTSSLSAVGPCGAAFTCVGGADFYHVGPSDHGAQFRFNFGTLAPLQNRTFNIFYGAAENETKMVAELAVVGAGLYTLGECSTTNPNCHIGGTSVTSHPANTGEQNTFAFGFDNIDLIPPCPSPPGAGPCPIIDPVPPTAAFKAALADGCSTQPMVFTDASSPGDRPIVSWAWDFGDGASSADANPSHLYAQEDTYLVTLTVTDDSGLAGTHTQSVVVKYKPCPIPLTRSQEDGSAPAPPRDGLAPSESDGDVDGDFRYLLMPRRLLS